MRCRAIVLEQVAFIQHNNIAPAQQRDSDAGELFQHLSAAISPIIPYDEAQLVVGDLFVVRPGEKVATDGLVVEGASAVDASLLTGEPQTLPATRAVPIYDVRVEGTDVIVSVS